ncbi:MAG: DUF362 domain-containing protein [Phycisphaerae bacterium]|nr:DUF362 domain-containing protein [Phycisphaerae bacterium]
MRDGKTRREFLGGLISAAAASVVCDPCRLLGQDGLGGSTVPLANAAPPVSRVARVVSERVLPVRIVQRSLLKDCIAQGLCALTSESEVCDAWHRVLKPDDVILLKFNRSGAEQLGTRPAMVAELLDSLVSAGWGLDKIIVLEAGSEVAGIRKTRPADQRWQGKEVEFGKSGKDSFIAALGEATAIVNVPFLKTHHLATMTSCLKNLSHGLIRHPSRFHANGCDPAIGEIVASAQIRAKLKLNIVNALRVVLDRGPEARESDMHTAGTLLFGVDPVACDATGYGILNELRSQRGLRPLLPGAQVPDQLVTAAKLGLGQLDGERIDVRNVEM